MMPLISLKIQTKRVIHHKEGSNFIEGHKDVFKDMKVPNAIVVDENPWCFQCSEAHWEHECLLSPISRDN
jgi:hypothetical protein